MLTHMDKLISLREIIKEAMERPDKAFDYLLLIDEILEQDIDQLLDELDAMAAAYERGVH
jgi:hypothetical protein